MSFIENIKKKKILNALVYYLGGGWAVIEASSFFVEKYGAGSSFVSLMLIILAFGLPLTLIFQWYRGDDLTMKLSRWEGVWYVALISSMIYVIILQEPLTVDEEMEESEVLKGSIAVLPFQKVGSGEAEDLYGDGFADDIISRLSKASGFTVISRMSSFQFRDSNRSIRKIRAKLRVENVLEGSYRLLNNQIRLNINLVQTDTEENLWSESFNGSVENIFDLQSKVAEYVANSLQLELGTSLINQKINPLAYEYYLKGNDLMRQRYISKSTLHESVAMLEKAIELDSTFTEAYVAIADVYTKYLYWGYDNYTNIASRAMEYIDLAKKHKATEGSFSSILAVLKHFNFEWEESQNYCRMALLEGYNIPTIYWIQARNALILNNYDLALSSMKELLKIDPLTSTYQVFYPYLLTLINENDKAVRTLEKYLQQSPGDNFALWVMGYTYNRMKNYEKAVTYFLKRDVKAKNENWMLGYSYGKLGKKEEALRIAQILEKKRETGTFVPAFMIGYIYLGMGETDKAFHLFDQAVVERIGWLGFTKLDPAFEEVRSDPRYLDLLKRINL